MYHAEIDLPDEMADQVQTMLRQTGKTLSQLVQQALARELRQQGDEMSDFFANLQPLESFADVDAESYVDQLRAKSRILHG